MSERPARSHFRRARRDAEKAQRRDAILASAGALLRASGFEGFSMSVLARKAGVAKGTLYLYFETREEVLLALYVETLRDFVEALTARLRAPMSDEDFSEAFEAAAVADPNFLALRARLESVIEHNVSVERLVEAKRAMRDLVGELAPRVEAVCRLAPSTGLPLLLSLAALQLGAAQSRLGPTASSLDLPEDVAEFMRIHAEYELFRETAVLIIDGLRRRSTPGRPRRRRGRS